VTGITIAGTYNTLGCCSTNNVFLGGPPDNQNPASGIPYLYADSLCCVDQGNGGTPTIFDPKFQNCCGPDSYDRANLNSEDVDSAFLFTYSEKLCCENPDGVGGNNPTLGIQGVEGCCGAIDDKGTDGTLYTFSVELCCDGDLYPFTGPIRCCNDQPYNNTLFGCCDDTVFSLATQGCCNDAIVYSLATEGCCDGVFFDSTTQGCCGATEVYDLVEELCCDVKQCEIVEDVIDVDDSGKKGSSQCPAIGGKKDGPKKKVAPKRG
jgi:hypothetical protein